MQVISGTIGDPSTTPSWRTPGPHTKDKGVNKWTGTNRKLDALAEEVAADVHTFDVYVDGELFLQTDFIRDCARAVQAAAERGQRAEVVYVGPERRESDDRRDHEDRRVLGTGR